MVIVAFFQWWYGRGWGWQWRYALANPARIARSFDLAMLSKTLFSPWKRISTAANQGSLIQRKLAQFGDALVSRLIGFLIRISVITVGLFALTIGSVFQVVLGLIWLFLPILPVALVVVGASW